VEDAIQYTRPGEPPNSTPPPPPATRRWVTYVLAFSVSVAVGLAPFLGVLKIPLFSPLLDLVPDSVRTRLIPLTSALMGLLAVVVQWFSEEDLDRATRRVAFRRSVMISFVGAIAFYCVTIFVVRHIDSPSKTFLIGFYRPSKGWCKDTSTAGQEEMSAAWCITHGGQTLDQDRITSYYGDTNVNLAELALSATYLTFMLGFASAVGIVIHRKGGRGA
jgi:hypothetical protein